MWIGPDLWTEEFVFPSKPGHSDLQSELFYDYRTKLNAYPTWQTWMLRQAASPASDLGKSMASRVRPCQSTGGMNRRLRFTFLDFGQFAFDTLQIRSPN